MRLTILFILIAFNSFGQFGIISVLNQQKGGAGPSPPPEENATFDNTNITFDNIVFTFDNAGATPTGSIYVDQRFVGTSTGSVSAPWKTVNDATQIAGPDAVIQVVAGSGVYRETAVFANSGTAGHLITLNFGVGSSISGHDLAGDGGWSVHSANIWKKTITLPKEVSNYQTTISSNTDLLANQVAKDGAGVVEARYPNVPNYEAMFLKSNLRYKTSTVSWTTTVLTDNGMPSFDKTGAIIWNNQWFISQTEVVTGSSSNSITTTTAMTARDYYYLTGKLGFLDAENEFHYESNTLYVWQPGGGSPTGISYKKRNYALDVSGKHHIKVTHMSVYGAEKAHGDLNTHDVDLDGRLNGNVLTTSTCWYPNHTVKQGHHTEGVSTQTGTMLLGDNNTIQYYDEYMSAEQMNWLGEFGLIKECRGWWGGYGGNYASYCSPWGKDADSKGNVTFDHLDLKYWGRSCLNVGTTTDDVHQNLTYTYIDMSYFGMLNADLGGFYSWGNNDLTGTTFDHCWIHDQQSEPGPGLGVQTNFYLDQMAGPITMWKCVMWNGKDADIYNQQDASSRFYQCTLASTDNHTYISYVNSPADILRDNIYRNSLNFNNGGNAGNSANSLTEGTNPLFVGTGTGGLVYRLQSGSPARDAGIVISPYTDGYLGTAPDQGGFEYNESWTPGVSWD